jgi:DNA-binding transcriptional regulator LsrR (DeoR family)
LSCCIFENQDRGLEAGRQELDTINLDSFALEIARKRLLQGISYKELARQYYTSPSTIHRRLAVWLRENRFDIQDRLAFKKNASITGKDDRLAGELVRRATIWRARVVQIEGVEAAYTDQYQSESHDEAAQNAFQAADDLHRCLGEVAADITLNSLRKNMTLGISSGRGVGFTVEALTEIVRQNPAWASGYESISLVSLCGGAHAGKWGRASAGSRDFDADANVYAMATALQVPRSQVIYISGPLIEAGGRPAESHLKTSLDIALIGVGQLNTRHHYFRDVIESRQTATGGPLQTLRDWQVRDPALSDGLIEIAMKLYPPNREMPPDFLDAIAEVNKTIISVSPEIIRNSGEVVLIAGGRQKLDAICGLLRGDYPQSPINRRNLTLITDSWTAAQILRHLD